MHKPVTALSTLKKKIINCNGGLIYTFAVFLLLAISNGYFFSFLSDRFFHLNLNAEFPGIEKEQVAILAILAAPLIETLIFQFFLYAFLTKTCKIKSAVLCVLIMSLIFSQVHWYNWLYVVAIFFGGIILNSFYIIIYKRNNFIVAFCLTVLFHTLYNLYATFF